MKLTFNIEKRIEIDGYIVENPQAVKIHKQVIKAIMKIVSTHLGRKLTADEQDEAIEYVETLA